MVPLSPQEFVDEYFEVGSVFKMNALDVDGFNSSVPHYFLVVAKDGGDGFLLVSTTQLQRKITYLEKTKRDIDSLVYIENTVSNGLTEDSYFDCNDKYDITRAKLIRKRKKGSLKYKGKLTNKEYSKLSNAIKKSKVSEIPKDLLIHPED